ncbi:MAG: helix-turn-helix domain-containing protein [Rhodoferax sp.]|uniref:helix-turn-helix domain-containing protein n=1 Tax=Rhodoferax sp. TaxID=50421 RepID=UPI00183CFF5D|nr:helix-turn-helix domain-containing protein [Rhodoferax sp.]NMM12588.1 helix-turn-helix domain-containing protein [Rhodoferax sp.]NMM19163.1 helix-turn-helix domain-containing protein [Rhodoferax sp.]
MSENNLSTSDLNAPEQSMSELVSAGTMLKNAREAEGLSIAVLAVSLKVPVKKLEALEADRFDLLPDNVFARALAASVCRTLKIDPAPILERLPHPTAPRLKTDESGINTPFRTSGDKFNLSFLNQLSKPFVLAVLVLLVGVVVLVFLPFTQRAEIANILRSDVAAINSPLQAPMSSDNDAANEAAAPPQVIDSTVATSAAPLAMSQASVVPLAILPGDVATASPAMVAGSGATTGTVVLTAHRSSWVEVVDASGVVQVRKTMKDGETVGASGVMPLSVVVGRADTTEVQVRGKPFDLSRLAKDNVARFEVK